MDLLRSVTTTSDAGVAEPSPFKRPREAEPSFTGEDDMHELDATASDRTDARTDGTRPFRVGHQSTFKSRQPGSGTPPFSLSPGRPNPATSGVPCDHAGTCTKAASSSMEEHSADAARGPSPCRIFAVEETR